MYFCFLIFSRLNIQESISEKLRKILLLPLPPVRLKEPLDITAVPLPRQTDRLTDRDVTSSSSGGITSDSSSGVRTSQKSGSKIINQSADTFQDLGVAGRDIPLTIKFIGDNHDLDANKFEKAFCEIGKSKLQLHYGNQIIVNAIEFTRKNSVIDNISCTIFEVKFHETADTAYPNADITKLQDLILKGKFLTTGNVANLVNTFNTVSQNISSYKKFMTPFTNNLNMITGVLQNIQDSKYLSILSDIQSQMPFNNALVMGTQIGLLYQAGLSTFNAASDIFNICSGAINQLMPSNPDFPTLASNDFFAKTALINTAQILASANIQTRKDAITAAQNYQGINQTYQQYIDSQIVTLSQNNTNSQPVSLAQDVDVYSLVQNTAGALYEQAFGLKTEMNIILDEPTNLIMLAYQYYPDDFAPPIPTGRLII